MHRLLQSARVAIPGALLGLSLLGLQGCGDSAQAPSTGKAPATTASNAAPAAASDTLASRGRSVYNANCVACHNPNPAEPGAIAPAIQGSSETLLEAKVLHNTYPPVYTPKRDTNAMIALPHLAKQIPALAAYLK